MKARIEKKICKRLLEVAPRLFEGAWIDSDKSALAYEQRSSVSGVFRIGGGIDEWGEGMDDYSLLEWLLLGYEWVGNFSYYPTGHRFEGMPDTSRFKPTTINLIRIAKEHG